MVNFSNLFSLVSFRIQQKKYYEAFIGHKAYICGLFDVAIKIPANKLFMTSKHLQFLDLKYFHSNHSFSHFGWKINSEFYLKLSCYELYSFEELRKPLLWLYYSIVVFDFMLLTVYSTKFYNKSKLNFNKTRLSNQGVRVEIVCKPSGVIIFRHWKYDRMDRQFSSSARNLHNLHWT